MNYWLPGCWYWCKNEIRLAIRPKKIFNEIVWTNKKTHAHNARNWSPPSSSWDRGVVHFQKDAMKSKLFRSSNETLLWVKQNSTHAQCAHKNDLTVNNFVVQSLGWSVNARYVYSVMLITNQCKIEIICSLVSDETMWFQCEIYLKLNWKYNSVLFFCNFWTIWMTYRWFYFRLKIINDEFAAVLWNVLLEKQMDLLRYVQKSILHNFF